MAKEPTSKKILALKPFRWGSVAGSNDIFTSVMEQMSCANHGANVFQRTAEGRVGVHSVFQGVV